MPYLFSCYSGNSLSVHELNPTEPKSPDWRVCPTPPTLVNKVSRLPPGNADVPVGSFLASIGSPLFNSRELPEIPTLQLSLWSTQACYRFSSWDPRAPARALDCGRLLALFSLGTPTKDQDPAERQSLGLIRGLITNYVHNRALFIQLLFL